MQVCLWSRSALECTIALPSTYILWIFSGIRLSVGGLGQSQLGVGKYPWWGMVVQFRSNGQTLQHPSWCHHFVEVSIRFLFLSPGPEAMCLSHLKKKRGVFMWLKTIWMTALQNEVNQVSLYFIMVVRPFNVVFFNAKLSIFISFLSFFIYFMDSPLRCPISFLRGSIYADMHIPISMSHNSFSVCNQNRQIPCRHEDTCSILMQQW